MGLIMMEPFRPPVQKFFAPRDAEDHPEREILAKARGWNWPKLHWLMPKPWDEGVTIDDAERRAVTRLTIECEISFKGKFQKRERMRYTRSNNWVPDVDYPDEFYGFNEVAWKNIYENTQTAPSGLRMRFMSPRYNDLAWIEKQGASIGRDRICEEWESLEKSIQKSAEGKDRMFQLESETARILCFEGLVDLKYSRGGKGYRAWFNLDNGRVLVP